MKAGERQGGYRVARVGRGERESARARWWEEGKGEGGGEKEREERETKGRGTIVGWDRGGSHRKEKKVGEEK